MAMETEDKLREIEERIKYYSKFNYTFLLLECTRDILHTIKTNGDPSLEVEALECILLPEWINETREKIEKVGGERDELLSELRKNKGKMGSYTYRGMKLGIYQKYAEWLVHEVIGLMNKNGLLLIREKFTSPGGYVNGTFKGE